MRFQEGTLNKTIVNSIFIQSLILFLSFDLNAQTCATIGAYGLSHCEDATTIELTATIDGDDCSNVEWYSTSSPTVPLGTGCSLTASYVSDTEEYFVKDASDASCPLNAVVLHERCYEICGDGIDNDGDGEIDEACAPLTCDGTLLQSINSNIYQMSVSPVEFNLFTSLPFSVNCLGYNPLDNLIYGVVRSGTNDGKIFRVDVNGDYEVLDYAILKDGTPYDPSNSADMGLDGNYYHYYRANGDGHILTIDINSLTEKSTVVVGANGNLADVAYDINTGNLYAVSDDVTKNLIEMNPTDGSTTIHPDIIMKNENGDYYTAASTVGGGVGAVYFLPNGELIAYGTFLYSNAQNDMVKFNLDEYKSTGEVIVMSADNQGVIGNDAASCPYTLYVEKSVNLDSLYAGEEVEYTIGVYNNSVYTLTDIVFTDTLSDYLTVSRVVSNDFGDDKIVSGMGVGSQNFRMEGLTIAPGYYEIVFNASITDTACDEAVIYNQAEFTNIPEETGFSGISDDPNTFEEKDATAFSLMSTNYPTPTVDVPSSFCEGGTIYLNASDDEGDTQWFGPSGSTFLGSSVEIINASSSDAGVYQVINTNGFCSSDTAEVDVLLFSNIQVSIVGAGICEGDTALLTASVTNEAGEVTYAWTPNTTISNITGDSIEVYPSETVIYQVIAEDTSGCTDTSTYEVEVYENPTVSISSEDVCDGGSATIESVVTSTSSVSYLWSPSMTLNTSTSSTVIATPTESTDYELLVTDANGCTISELATVGVTSSPVAELLNVDTTICDDEWVDLLAFDDDTEDYTFEWFYSSNDVDYVSMNYTSDGLRVDSAGYYRVTISNEGFCEETSTSIMVEVLTTETLSVLIEELDTLCEEASVTLSATIENGGESPTIEWGYSEDASLTSSTTTFTITDLEYSSGMVNIDVISSLRCVDQTTKTDEAPLVVVEKPVPYVYALDDTLCEGSSTTVYGLDSTGQLNEYVWYRSGSEISVDGLEISNVNTTSTYRLAADNGICEVQFSDDVAVNVITYPRVNASNEIGIQEFSIEEDIVVEGSHTGDFMEWSSIDDEVMIESPNTEQTEIYVPEGGVYVIVLTSWSGPCTVSDTTILDVKVPIEAPSVFTPNGDGLHEVFQIKGIETYPGGRVFIYNRWGTLIFDTDNYANQPWDGGDAPEGAYYFVIELNDEVSYAGIVQLLR